MARLCNPGVGEILDRLSILTLKRLHGDAAGRDTTHFAREGDQLEAMIALRKIPTAETIQLTAVNAMLWHAEDQLRAYRRGIAGATGDDGLVAVVAVAFRIQDLNDQRNQVIEAINKAAGDFAGPEKDRG
jgi:hypothetical protein